jgi:hypothetical protein
MLAAIVVTVSGTYPLNPGDQPGERDPSRSNQRPPENPPQPPQEGYPPQQGYPEQGYPPQQGYPKQGYPSQEGYPRQGYVQPGLVGGGQTHPKGTPVLVLGILSIVFCGFGLILGPLAIVQGGRALKEIDAARGLYNNRQTVNLGRILGIIGTILSVLGVLWVTFVVALGIGGATVNGY